MSSTVATATGVVLGIFLAWWMFSRVNVQKSTKMFLWGTLAGTTIATLCTLAHAENETSLAIKATRPNGYPIDAPRIVTFGERAVQLCEWLYGGPEVSNPEMYGIVEEIEDTYRNLARKARGEPPLADRATLARCGPAVVLPPRLDARLVQFR